MRQAAQTGIAVLSLTYGFDTDSKAVILSPGNITIPDLTRFYPLGIGKQYNITIQDEEYMAHL